MKLLLLLAMIISPTLLAECPIPGTVGGLDMCGNAAPGAPPAVPPSNEEEEEDDDDEENTPLTPPADLISPLSTTTPSAAPMTGPLAPGATPAPSPTPLFANDDLIDPSLLGDQAPRGANAPPSDGMALLSCAALPDPMAQAACLFQHVVSTR